MSLLASEAAREAFSGQSVDERLGLVTAAASIKSFGEGAASGLSDGGADAGGPSAPAP